MNSSIHVASIIISIALIAVVLIQAKGAGGLGGIFGGSQSSGGYRTRRGVEQTLFRLTIILAVIFVVISALSVKLD
ncbi:MAG: preprotein translocase subunit SecG [Chloroflexi bacterium]|jgi:preprotein translocase subunit SecG|nr:preprotein translocase subunit SecG [Chloroflexota bacterium]